ncbi:hypothetical protein HK099_000897 [Clydaea vesicula]|uniref:Glutathione S-transferase n=1 Tax=Clydaea vesicula TaxID=447962 RepID=A0AAD5TUK5_9FUNG|nr:hypothetical protein HK099_000897 [Clydaea vesicula]
MSKTTPSLMYYSTRGARLLEVIRLVLAEAQVEYNDVSVGTFNKEDPPKDFLELKESGKLTFNQLPAYDEPESGLFLVQNQAILNHVARKYKLYGKTLEEAAQIDVLLEGIKDLNDLEEASLEELFEKDLPYWFTLFEKYLEKKYQREGKNEKDELFFVGNDITVADITMFYNIELLLESLKIVGWESKFNLDSYPYLKSNYILIENREGIKNYVNGGKRREIHPLF